MNEVTVIIPAYNAEWTVGRAVRSVLASTVPVDVVVVDDGSSDATAAAAEKAAAECAAERGSSFRLVRQANAGAYTARVRALAGVETPYFAFVDADDAVEPSMYERLLAFSRANDLDIAQCDAVGAARAAVPQELFLGEAQVREKVVLPRLMRGEGAVSVWDKLYRNRLGGAGFEPSDIMMFEDLAINLQLFVGAERVGYLHEGLYRYDVNPGSAAAGRRGLRRRGHGRVGGAQRPQHVSRRLLRAGAGRRVADGEGARAAGSSRGGEGFRGSGAFVPPTRHAHARGGCARLRGEAPKGIDWRIGQ